METVPSNLDQVMHCVTGGACMAAVRRECVNVVDIKSLVNGCFRLDRLITKLGCRPRITTCLSKLYPDIAKAIETANVQWKTIHGSSLATSARRASEKVSKNRRAQEPKSFTPIEDTIKGNMAVGAAGSQIAIELGYTLDVTIMGDNYFRSECFDLNYVNSHKSSTPAYRLESSNRVITDSEQSILNLNGSLDMIIPLDIAVISAKAQIDMNNTTNMATRTSIAKQTSEAWADTLDISKVQDSDLHCSQDIKFTHIVTKVVRGKQFDATLKLTSKIEQSNADGQEHTKATLEKISGTVGGYLTLSIPTEEINSYNFKSEVKTTGGIPVSAETDVNAFIKTSALWQSDAQARQHIDKENPNVISYELTPVYKLGNFANKKILRDAHAQMMLAKAKIIINNMIILEASMMYLLGVTKENKHDDLQKKIDAVQDANLLLVDAGVDNKIDDNLLKNSEQYRLSVFMEDPYYKQLVAEIPSQDIKAKSKCKRSTNGRCGALFGDSYCPWGTCSQWNWCGVGLQYEGQSDNRRFDSNNCKDRVRRRRRMFYRK